MRFVKYKRFVIFVLIFIVFIASVLRLYRLGEVPASLNWDEVSLGYNAYSILETGQDEYGAHFPLVLRSFDDYKPALYSYLVIPAIKTFGLNAFAVRLPSALFGILAVVASYFLVLELSGKKKFALLNKEIPIELLGLLVAFLLAISPWHIQFSRIAFESNVGLSINLFIFLLFLKSLRRPWLLLPAFILGGVNIHMYQSDRVFTPLLLFSLSIIYYREIWKNKLWYVIGVMIAVLIVLPFIIFTFTNQNALLRAKGVSVFSDQTHLLEESAEKLIYDKETGNRLGLLLDNRRIEFGKLIVAGYISHFDLNWLFITGDIARHHAPKMGLLYLFELPFLFIGIYMLIFGKFDKRIKIALITYFLLVPIPASITSGVPHAVRTLNFLPVFQVFVALGLIASFIKVSSIGIKHLIFVLFSIIFILNFSYYLNQYFVQLNYFTSRDWLYGYKEAVSFIEPIMENYDNIIVSNEQPLDQSYMFFLFYLKYSPEKYLSEGGSLTGGFAESHKFDKFEFRPINDEDKNREKTLFVGRPSDYSADLKKLKTVHYLNGEVAIIISEKK